MDRTIKLRLYQKEAIKAIDDELFEDDNDKCIVKMFCGTGKSLVMKNCNILKNKKVISYVFPTLSLLDQYYHLYIDDKKNCLKICSEIDSTTDENIISNFIENHKDKLIILITYQSFDILISFLEKKKYKINVCIFDEAHHAVGETYQKLIFNYDEKYKYYDKQIFFTATPKNANSIIMYDPEESENNMCGNLVYDYPYLNGLNEGYLNDFEIRVNMSMQNTNESLYETISRAILASENNRVLTFHADVNTDRDTSVKNFVNDLLFRKIFRETLEKEFPNSNRFKKIKMVSLTADTNIYQRREILDRFDKTPDDEIIIISSCETIGEGIDTKNANMAVFVDPKSSYIKIIQNIGRIVRKF